MQKKKKKTKLLKESLETSIKNYKQGLKVTQNP